jgi:hypothetical protein
MPCCAMGFIQFLMGDCLGGAAAGRRWRGMSRWSFKGAI